MTHLRLVRRRPTLRERIRTSDFAWYVALALAWLVAVAWAGAGT